jgi:hypothetical protein
MTAALAGGKISIVLKREALGCGRARAAPLSLRGVQNFVRSCRFVCRQFSVATFHREIMLLGPLRNRHNKHGQEPDPGDGAGPYSYDKLLKMDQRYCSAVERAFKLGTESREAAERLFKAN